MEHATSFFETKKNCEYLRGNSYLYITIHIQWRTFRNPWHPMSLEWPVIQYKLLTYLQAAQKNKYGWCHFFEIYSFNYSFLDTKTVENLFNNWFCCPLKLYRKYARVVATTSHLLPLFNATYLLRVRQVLTTWLSKYFYCGGSFTSSFC